eukprot:3428241-Pyramimonas_sp.AAC.1
MDEFGMLLNWSRSVPLLYYIELAPLCCRYWHRRTPALSHGGGVACRGSRTCYLTPPSTSPM